MSLLLENRQSAFEEKKSQHQVSQYFPFFCGNSFEKNGYEHGNNQKICDGFDVILSQTEFQNDNENSNIRMNFAIRLAGELQLIRWLIISMPIYINIGLYAVSNICLNPNNATAAFVFRNNAQNMTIGKVYFS